MLHQLNTASLSFLGEEAKDEALDALVSHTRTANGSASEYLQNRVKTFELRYEMTSEELLEALADGRQRETAEVAEWLFLLDTLEAHGG